MKNLLASVATFGILWAAYEYFGPKDAFFVMAALVSFGINGLQHQVNRLGEILDRATRVIDDHIYWQSRDDDDEFDRY